MRSNHPNKNFPKVLFLLAGLALALFFLVQTVKNGTSTIEKPASAKTSSEKNLGQVQSIHPVGDTFNKMAENTTAFARALTTENLFANKDYEKTYQSLAQKQAELNPEEMRMMGFLLLHGYGVQKDFAAARVWFQASVEAGNINAAALLGYIYEKGLGVRINYESARKLYAAAANSGDVLAMNNLGHLYEHGLGVVQNMSKAFELYEESASGGNTLAMNNLGWSMITKKSTEKDINQGLDWLKKAANADELRAIRNLEFIYKEGLKTERDRALAQTWKAKGDALEHSYSKMVQE